jgi:ribosome-binding protein aMBF1 (putative translation factor)
LEAASLLATNHLANIEETLRRIQEQIRDAIEREADPEKVRRLLGASENLASLTQSAPGPDLEKLLSAALRELGPEAHRAEAGSGDPPRPESRTDVIVSDAETSSGRAAQPDLDALIGSSPAEQDAARDAEVILRVGEMVRSARIARGITQAELAARTRMTQSHISEIERGLGRIGPTVVTLRRLLNALGDELVVASASGRNSRRDTPAQKGRSTRRAASA